ncbi:hypothetical protein FBU30_004326 [Linnemannia zychae]|nr:hypothetical protein FBU30_004326 [Linnemannia zychae]
MFEIDNFISFHDLTPNGTFIWASPSVSAILGYEPEEIEGVPAYDVMHKDDIAYCRLTHQENVLNDMVGTQIVIRFKHKDGSYVPCMCIFSVCYDYIVTCSTIIDTAQEAFRKVYTHSAAMTSIVGSRHKEFERIRRHHKAFSANSWNANTLDPEPRACMILNRFSRNLGIMYASPSCQMIFKIDPDKAIGKPLLVFLRADDLAGFVEQAELAKSSNVVTHMRFWFQSPNCRNEIPCEAMMFGAADGLVAVLRRCRPFMRRQAITAGIPTPAPIQDNLFPYNKPQCTCETNSHSEASTPLTSSYSSSGSSVSKPYRYHRNDTNNDSSGRNYIHSHHHNCPAQHRDSPAHSYQDVHCPVTTGTTNPNVMSGFVTNPSLTGSLSTSYSSISSSDSSSFGYSPSSQSTSSYTPSPGRQSSQMNSSFQSTWFSTKTIKSPFQGIPIGSINSIRNLDKDQQRIRPLRSLQDDSLDIVENNTQLPPSYRLRTYHTQETEVEVAELDSMMSQLGTGADEDDVDENKSEDDEEFEVIDCRARSRYEPKELVMHYRYNEAGVDDEDDSSDDEVVGINEMDMEIEETSQILDSKKIQSLDNSSIPSIPSSNNARQKLDKDENATAKEDENSSNEDSQFDGSPVPKLAIMQ